MNNKDRVKIHLTVPSIMSTSEAVMDAIQGALEELDHKSEQIRFDAHLMSQEIILRFLHERSVTFLSELINDININNLSYDELDKSNPADIEALKREVNYRFQQLNTKLAELASKNNRGLKDLLAHYETKENSKILLH